MTDDDTSAAAFMRRVDDILSSRPGLSRLGAGVLAAAELGIAGDSRAFARAFAVEHALVLREISALEVVGLLHVDKRDPRTMRSWIRLTGPAA